MARVDAILPAPLVWLYSEPDLWSAAAIRPSEIIPIRSATDALDPKPDVAGHLTPILSPP
jgi:hypothetical protein